MDCLEFRKNLLLHVGRELPEEEERRIRLHLEACPCCQRRARYEERFQSMLRELLAPPPLPPGLRDRICHRLAREDRSAPPPPKESLLLLRPRLAAPRLLPALSAALAGVTMLWKRSAGDTPAVRLVGRLVCRRCEKEDVLQAGHAGCLVAEHPTGLRTLQGTVLSLSGSGAASLQGDCALRGMGVEIQGVLDPHTGTLEVLRYILMEEGRVSGLEGTEGDPPDPVL